MKNALLGLLAIPLVIALVYLPGQVSACGGGGNYHDEIYFSGTVNATAGNYGVQGFTVASNTSHVLVRSSTNTRVMVIADDQMANFTAGKNFTSAYDSKGEPSYLGTLTAGRYWVVLDATKETTDATAQVLIETMAPKMEAQCIYEPRPFYVEYALQSGLVAVAICVSAVVTVLVRKT